MLKRSDYVQKTTSTTHAGPPRSLPGQPDPNAQQARENDAQAAIDAQPIPDKPRKRKTLLRVSSYLVRRLKG